MIKIGNNTFDVPAPGGMRSFALQQRILPVAGRVANVIMKVLDASGGSRFNMASLLDADAMQMLQDVMPQVAEVFSAMPPGELEAITRILLTDAKIDNMPLFPPSGPNAFDGFMQGRTVDTWRLLWHALEVWYPDFFTSVRVFRAKEAAASHSAGSTIYETSGHVGA